MWHDRPDGRLEADSDVDVLRTPDGDIEIAWPLIQTIKPTQNSASILAHKLSVYVFNAAALRYLLEDNPQSVFILYTRDPQKSLLSWHNMHRNIATSGRYPNHFAYKDRDFYRDCSIHDYYERFAKDRLRYDIYFSQMLAVIPKERLVVISQERMVEDITSVMQIIKAIAYGQSPEIPILSTRSASTKHKGFADKTRAEVDPYIQAELAGVKNVWRAWSLRAGYLRWCNTIWKLLCFEVWSSPSSGRQNDLSSSCCATI